MPSKESLPNSGNAQKGDVMSGEVSVPGRKEAMQKLGRIRKLGEWKET